MAISPQEPGQADLSIPSIAVGPRIHILVFDGSYSLSTGCFCSSALGGAALSGVENPIADGHRTAGCDWRVYEWGVRSRLVGDTSRGN